MLKNQCENSQRELSGKDVKIQELTRIIEEMKKNHETKEAELRKREEEMQVSLKTEK